MLTQGGSLLSDTSTQLNGVGWSGFQDVSFLGRALVMMALAAILGAAL